MESTNEPSAPRYDAAARTDTMNEPIVLCPHGNPTDDYVEVTNFGDKRRAYVATLCDCPLPYCPLCGTELDTQGRCQGDIECALHGHPVPNPEVR